MLSWEQYFILISIISSLRSKDPVTQVGACLVKDNKIIGIGYNGFPNNCPDDIFPWNKDSSNPLENKYCYVVHAELNAILNSNPSFLKDSILYTTLYPCNECAKAIIQSGIKEVKYLHKKQKYYSEASEKMFLHSGIKEEKLNIDFSQILNIIYIKIKEFIL